MKTGENKMQSAASPSRCPKCSGSGKTKKADGSLQRCFDCRGTGEASGKYQTK